MLNKEKRLETLNKAFKHANSIKPNIITLKEELKLVKKEETIRKTRLEDFVNQENILKNRVEKIAKSYEEKIKPYIEEIDKVKENQTILRKKYKNEMQFFEKKSIEIANQVVKKKNLLKTVESQVAASKSLLEDEFDKIKIASEEIRQLDREKALIVREINDRKTRYENWTVKEADKVAKKIIKNKLENIDKAGLKDILNAI